MFKYVLLPLLLLALCPAVPLIQDAEAASARGINGFVQNSISGSAADSSAATGLVNFRILLPGSNLTLDMVQAAAFPLGCPQLFLILPGTGTLTITLQKNDISGDGIFMLGIAASDAGTERIYRIGVSKGLITQSVSLKAETRPFGFVWLYSGVLYSSISPKYSYTVQLSYEPET